jgi:mono/diheme cytochrome c family protein
MLSVRALAGIMLLLSVGGCGPHDPRADNVVTLKGDPVSGAPLYQDACARCHGADGGHLRGALAWYSPVASISMVIDGAHGMPAFAGYSDQQLADIDAHIRSLK